MEVESTTDEMVLKNKIKELEKKNKELEKKYKELENKSKEIPKHGDKKLFRYIVYHDTGFEVIKSTPQQLEEAKMLAILARDYQIDKNGNTFKNKDGLPRKRFNECGNDMEVVLKQASDGKLKGMGKASGYPDLLNEISCYYLECKVADVKSIESSFRSFYLSTLNKVTKSQAHILVCFKHHNGKLSIAKNMSWYNFKNINNSLQNDLKSIRNNLLIPKNLKIFGFIYHVESGKLLYVNKT